MPHHMLRSAAGVLLASAPLLTAAPALAAPGNFPCTVALQKISSQTTSMITLTVACQTARTVDVTLTAGSAELANSQLTVQAGGRQSVTLTVPKVPQVCATLMTDGLSTTACTPDH